MVDIRGSTSSAHYSITARPNCSISPADTMIVFSVVSAVSLIFAIGCFWLGAWPVLPFVLSELSALFLCFRYVWRHAGDYERLIMDDDRIVLEVHQPGHDRHVELNSYWAQVLMDYRPDGGCRRLALRSHGQEIEFGRLLTKEERLALGNQLKDRLGGFMGNGSTRRAT